MKNAHSDYSVFSVVTYIIGQLVCNQALEAAMSAFTSMGSSAMRKEMVPFRYMP